MKNIKEITPDNQEKIDQILSYHKLSKNLQKNNLKKQIKL